MRECEGTLVSVDLSGFTRLFEQLQPRGRAGVEELVLAVSSVFQGLIGIADSQEGDVLKFRGDALLLFFDGEAHERRACRTAWDMARLIETSASTSTSDGSAPLRMSTGVYTGDCHFFLIEGTHRELVVAGPAATATVELESAASAGQILVSERTAAALDADWLGEAQKHGRLLLDAGGGGSELRQSVEPPEVAEGLAQYLPEPLRASLLLDAAEAEHRQVTTAFLRFTGVDEALATDGAPTVHADLSALAQIVGDETRRLGVMWLESDIDVDGGKLYLVGGAPSSTGDDEERMLRVLQAVLESYRGLSLRAGISRGSAFCGVIGAETRKTYAVMGDTVNLAARLVSRADPGVLLASADVLERARTLYETDQQLLLLKGKELPITAYRVGLELGKKEEEPQPELPLLGREDELAALTLALAGARGRRQQVVELVGEPGIGKSRLIREVKKHAPGFVQLVGRCDPYSSASAYSVFRDLLRPLVGLTSEMNAREAGVHLREWIHAVLPELASYAPLMAVPFDAEIPPTPETERIEPRFLRERLHDCMAALFSTLITPTLLIVEDAHWIDDASRDLLLALTRVEVSRPCLVCVLRRPHGGDFADPGVGGHVRLVLGPIDGESARALAHAAAGEAAVSDDVLGAVAHRAGGNPLFVRELVAASRGTTDVSLLPDSVETLILTRIDTLVPEDRFLLRNASVFGARFELELLAQIVHAELPDARNRSQWERLSEFVVWEGPGRLRFVHDLFRAVAYEGLSFRRRREVHGRIGAALEARARDASGDLADLLSLHYHRAAEHESAWRYSVLAGRRAQARAANVEAIELYERALEVADSCGATPKAIAEVAEALGDVAVLAARYETANAAYERALRSVPEDLIAQSHLLRKAGILRERRGRYAAALRFLDRALGLLEGAEDSVDRARCRADVELAYGGVKHRQGRFDETYAWAERAARSAQAGADRTRLAHAYYLSHLALLRSGQRVPERRDEALAILEEVGDLARLTNLQNNVGIEAYFEGRWEDALNWYRKSRESASRIGDVVNVATSQNNEAEILSDRGQFEEARALFEQGLRVWRAADYRIGVALATSNLGRVMARSGQFDEARRLLDEALAQFRELGAEAYVVETQARLAECLVLEGHHREALDALVPLREPGSSQLAIAERLTGYAVVQSRAGFEQARPHFERSLEAAEASGAEYEVALTLHAIAETSGVDDGRAAEILGRLGVVSLPSVPLP